MRTKKAVFNNLSAASLQMINLIFGLIIPRLMIQTYGSELNGLLSSSKQMVSYLRYLEMGITTALIYTLYSPLAKSDFEEINPLVTRSKNEYDKISFWYTIAVVILSIVYPIMLKEDIGYGTVFIIVLFVGLYGALDFLTLAKHRVLLMADQRYYVITLSTIFTIIFQNITLIGLIYFEQSIILIAFAPIIFLPLRSWFLNYYIKKHYSLIDYKVEPSKIKLESRKDAFISGLANTLSVSLPIVIVSLVVSLVMASVFSVYSLVFLGISNIIGIFTSGMSTTFGNMFAKNQKSIIKKGNNYYEFLIYILITILYASTLALIIPFINVYMGDVADINYVYPSIGILFTLWGVIHGTVIPNQTIINASGKWKLSTKTNIIQIIILIIFTFVLGYFWDVNGILIGMILSSTVRTLSLMHISNKKILDIGSSKNILRIIRSIIIIFIINVPLYYKFSMSSIDSFSKWIIYAVIITFISSVVTIIINLLLDWKTVKELLNRYIRKNNNVKLKEDID